MGCEAALECYGVHNIFFDILLCFEKIESLNIIYNTNI